MHLSFIIIKKIKVQIIENRIIKIRHKYMKYISYGKRLHGIYEPKNKRGCMDI